MVQKSAAPELITPEEAAELTRKAGTVDDSVRGEAIYNTYIETTPPRKNSGIPQFCDVLRDRGDICSGENTGHKGGTAEAEDKKAKKMTVKESRLIVLRKAQRTVFKARAAEDFYKLVFPPHWYKRHTPQETETVYKNYSRLYSLFEMLSHQLFELDDLLGDLEYSIETSRKCYLGEPEETEPAQK